MKRGQHLYEGDVVRRPGGRALWRVYRIDPLGGGRGLLLFPLVGRRRAWAPSERAARTLVKVSEA